MRSYSGLCVEFPHTIRATGENFQEESAETANSSSCAEYHFVVLNLVCRMRKRKLLQLRLIGFAVACTCSVARAVTCTHSLAHTVTCTYSHGHAYPAAVPHSQLHYDFADPAA